MTTPTPVAASTPPERGRILPGGAPVVPVVLLGTGVFLAWFGIHYWRSTTALPTDVLKSVLQGKGLPPVVKSQGGIRAGLGSAAAGLFTGPGFGGTGSGAAVSADALQYVGQGYVYGGRAERPGDWDCSSFLSYVLGHDFGLRLPGGGSYGDTGYPPNEHGPVASAYKLYGVGIEEAQVAPGDLVVWNTHCGIAVDNTRIVAARTESTGTGLSTSAGVTQELGETPVFRRIVFSTNTTGGGVGGGAGAGAGGGKANVR